MLSQSELLEVPRLEMILLLLQRRVKLLPLKTKISPPQPLGQSGNLRRPLVTPKLVLGTLGQQRRLHQEELLGGKV